MTGGPSLARAMTQASPQIQRYQWKAVVEKVSRQSAHCPVIRLARSALPMHHHSAASCRLRDPLSADVTTRSCAFATATQCLLVLHFCQYCLLIVVPSLKSSDFYRNLDPTFKGSIPFTPETPWLCVLFHCAHSIYQAITLQCFLAVEPGKNFKKVVTCCRIPI